MPVQKISWEMEIADMNSMYRKNSKRLFIMRGRGKVTLGICYIGDCNHPITALKPVAS